MCTTTQHIHLSLLMLIKNNCAISFFVGIQVCYEVWSQFQRLALWGRNSYCSGISERRGTDRRFPRSNVSCYGYTFGSINGLWEWHKPWLLYVLEHKINFYQLSSLKTFHKHFYRGEGVKTSLLWQIKFTWCSLGLTYNFHAKMRAWCLKRYPITWVCERFLI